MKHTITAAMLEQSTISDLLQSLQDDYGVALRCVVGWRSNYGVNGGPLITVDLVYSEHRSELNGLPALITPLLSTKVMELEKQIKFALMLWEAHLDAHMR